MMDCVCAWVCVRGCVGVCAFTVLLTANDNEEVVLAELLQFI